MKLSKTINRISPKNLIVEAIKKGVQNAITTRQIPTLTRAQFLEWIALTNGAVLVGIEALTDAKVRKTNNPHPKVFKRSRCVAMIGANYEAAVNREAGRQGVEDAEFKAESLPWGEWVPGAVNKILSHNDKFYIRTQSTPNQRAKSKARILDFRDEAGHILARDIVEPFLPKSAPSTKQQAAGLEKTVDVKNFAVDSIKKVRIMGVTYRLTD